ncbi:hypothetical protein HJ117_02470 [Vibrio parahaemolyticus]|nr:hypothetical protein [Vibrio parahaemolyticus]
MSDDKGKSSHSLGKTTLVDVIDFCLLKQINKNSVLKNKRLSELKLFLEIHVGLNKYVTIKRDLSGKIAVMVTKEPCNMAVEPAKGWDHDNLPFTKAKEIVNELICPELLSESGFNFRSGLRYCLRKQTNYEETFKVRAGQEPSSNWVPYLGSILGIDVNLINEKFKSNKKSRCARKCN